MVFYRTTFNAYCVYHQPSLDLEFPCHSIKGQPLFERSGCLDVPHQASSSFITCTGTALKYVCPLIQPEMLTYQLETSQDRIVTRKCEACSFVGGKIHLGKFILFTVEKVEPSQSSNRGHSPAWGVRGEPRATGAQESACNMPIKSPLSFLSQELHTKLGLVRISSFTLNTWMGKMSE